MLIKKGSGLLGVEELKALDFLPLPEEGDMEEGKPIGSFNSQLEVQACCSSQGNESIASPAEEDNLEDSEGDVEIDFEDSDGDIEIEEMSESESHGSVEIEIEASADASQSRESETESLGNVQTGVETSMDDASQSIESESLGNVKIGVETSQDASQSRESESSESIETGVKTLEAPKSKENESFEVIGTGVKTLDAPKSREKFHIGERVLCYEPHFYMMHKAKIVSRSKRKGWYWVDLEGWSSKENVEIKRDLLMKDTPANHDLMKEVNAVKEEGGEGVTFSAGEEVLCYEPDLKKVNKIYEAMIVRVLHLAGETESSYLVHFPGWGSKHNKRVDRSLLLTSGAQVFFCLNIKTWGYLPPSKWWHLRERGILKSLFEHSGKPHCALLKLPPF